MLSRTRARRARRQSRNDLRRRNATDDSNVLTWTRRRMMFAMNRFRVKRSSEEAFEQVWLSRDTQLTKVPVSSSSICSRDASTRTNTLYSSMAEQGDVRSLDQVGSIPSCPSGRRPEQAALPRPSAVRRLRGPPDGASRRRCGRVERLPIRRGPHLPASFAHWNRYNRPPRPAFVGGKGGPREKEKGSPL
jgi:hypothetical protein